MSIHLFSLVSSLPAKIANHNILSLNVHNNTSHHELNTGLSVYV